MHMLPGGAVKTESYAQRIKLGSSGFAEPVRALGKSVNRQGAGFGFRVLGFGLRAGV